MMILGKSQKNMKKLTRWKKSIFCTVFRLFFWLSDSIYLYFNKFILYNAPVAQLVVHLFCKQKVKSSILFGGILNFLNFFFFFFLTLDGYKKSVNIMMILVYTLLQPILKNIYA